MRPPPTRSWRAVPLDALVRDEVGESDERVSIVRLDPATVPGEPAALRRMLHNLIENALVHGPPQGPVEVGLDAAASTATITVRDAGPGPDPVEAERLFERFWRGAGAAGRPGSGLGLSIVAAIAERHGGTVAVDGSAFSVVLPLVAKNPR